MEKDEGRMKQIEAAKYVLCGVMEGIYEAQMLEYQMEVNRLVEVRHTNVSCR